MTTRGEHVIIMKEMISHITSFRFSCYTWNGDGYKGWAFLYWAFEGKYSRGLPTQVNFGYFSNLVSLLITGRLVLWQSFLEARQIPRTSIASSSQPGETWTLSKSRMLELPEALGAPKITQINRTRELCTRVTWVYLYLSLWHSCTARESWDQGNISTVP